MQVGEIEADADRLPLGVVEIRAQEDALPFVEETRVEIELAVEQFQPVVGLPLSDGQESFGQRGAEAEAQIVSFLAVGLDGHERGSVEGHGGGVLAELAVEAERALARELVDRFVLEVRSADAAVETRDVNAAQELNRAVFAAVVGRAEALVVGHSVRAGGAVLARLVSAALVDFQLAVVSFVAGQTLARVIVDSVQAGAELARRLAAGRSGRGQGAFVNVDLAVDAFKAGQTSAEVPA